ncbi:MAG: hypothetical protein FWD15_01815 [Alphaproteobacteria bacterium]|nr:hypothetical protein [Alphaproteobacteria bacterium]
MKKILGVVLATVLASVPAAAANGIQHALRSPLTLDAFEEISFYAGIGYHPLARTNYRLAGDKTSFSGDAIGFSLGIEKGYTRGEVAYTRSASITAASITVSPRATIIISKGRSTRLC